jgi:fructokinase
MRREFTVVGLGEVLWDLLPAGKQLGGAPANFAYISTLLGDRGVVASRVGNEALGDEAAERLRTLGRDVSYLQRDRLYPTGTVPVEVNRSGHPRFKIRKHVAWDFLGWTPSWKRLAEKADAVCFGALAQRSPRSRATIGKFLRYTRKDAVRVFDVNLRQGFYCAEVLQASFSVATIVKMNQEELPVILTLLGLEPGEEKRSAKRLLAFGPELVCVTRGERGSLLVTEKRAVEHAGFLVRVKDTIGSGDAFTAGLVHQYLRGASLQKMSEAANRVGSWVASEVGGMPVTDKRELPRRLTSLVAR